MPCGTLKPIVWMQCWWLRIKIGGAGTEWKKLGQLLALRNQVPKTVTQSNHGKFQWESDKASNPDIDLWLLSTWLQQNKSGRRKKRGLLAGDPNSGTLPIQDHSLEGPQFDSLPGDSYRKMKHSNDTRGFSSDSFVAGGGGGHFPSFSVCSTFLLLPGAAAAAGTRLGDCPVFLADGLRPMPDLEAPLSERVAGDLDLRAPFSLESRRRLSICLTVGWLPSLAETDLTLPGDGSDLLAGDFPTPHSLFPPKSPEGGRWLLRNLAGDLNTLCRTSHSSRLRSSSSLLSVMVVVETLSLMLQISEISEISSTVLTGTFSWIFSSSSTFFNASLGEGGVVFSSSTSVGGGLGAGVSESTSLTASSSIKGGGVALPSHPLL